MANAQRSRTRTKKTKTPLGSLGKKRTQAAGKATHPDGRFLLTYAGVEDPDPTIVAGLVKALAPAKVEEVLPGTLKVEGDRLKIRRKVSKLGEWSLSTEGMLSAAPPAKTRIDLFRR